MSNNTLVPSDPAFRLNRSCKSQAASPASLYAYVNALYSVLLSQQLLHATTDGKNSLLAKRVQPTNLLRCAQDLPLDVQAWHRGIRDAWSTLASAKRRKRRKHAHSSPFQALHAHAAHWAAPSKGLASGQERPLEDICKVLLHSALLQNPSHQMQRIHLSESGAACMAMAFSTIAFVSISTFLTSLQ